MKTTQTGQAIINEAKSWLDQGCKEQPKGSQKVYCGSKFISWDRTPAANNDAWCAAFVSAVIGNALTKLGLQASSFPMTAGAKDMLNKSLSSHRGYEVNGTPKPGAAFYRYSTSKDASGHVGIVVNVEGSKIYTIEGNANDAVGYFTYDKSEFDKRGFKFMHAEQIGNEWDYTYNNPMEFIDSTDDTPSKSDGEIAVKPLFNASRQTNYRRNVWL